MTKASASGSSSMSLPEFLQRASRRVQSSSCRIHAFVGNEASDADSICSAICMAYLEGLSQEGRMATDDRHANPTETSSEVEDVIHVPVVPIPRADLALRREVLVLFELCGVDPTTLMFIDEVDLLGFQAEGRLDLTLVDHNAVSGPLSHMGESVVRIVDHHKDLGEHQDVQGDVRDIAYDEGIGSGRALVGSCCTLVAERWLKFAPEKLSAEVAKLLLGVILIDTMNFDVSAGRATSRDRIAADELMIKAGMKGGDVAADPQENSDGNFSLSGDSRMQALWEKLKGAKFDPDFWHGLSVKDCLRYDYKRFAVGRKASDTAPTGERSLAFGTSSMLCRLETLLQKSGAVNAMYAFARERGVDSLVVSTVTFGSGRSGNMRKELLVFSEDRQRCRELEAHLEGKGGDFLELKRISQVGEGGDADGTSAIMKGSYAQWEYMNLKASRKQIVPAIIPLYESLLSDQGRV